MIFDGLSEQANTASYCTMWNKDSIIITYIAHIHNLTLILMSNPHHFPKIKKENAGRPPSHHRIASSPIEEKVGSTTRTWRVEEEHDPISLSL